MKLLTTEESMYSCVRCGACRDVCPTLDITGKEADGPRGRVMMARSLLEGTLAINAEIEEQLDRCLLCSACVDACPLDVAVPDIVMDAKEKIAEEKKKPWLQRTVLQFFLTSVLPHQKRLHVLGHFLWFYQKSGLQALLRSVGIFRLLPEGLRGMETVLPEIAPPQARKAHPVFSAGDSVANGSKEKVDMFRGCIMDVLFRETNDNTIRLLNRAGLDVQTPQEQVCCGALHAHNGNKDKAKELAKQNIEKFEASGGKYIISNAGGCGAMLLEYGELLRDDPKWAERAKRFSDRVRDVSEVLLKEGALPTAQGAGERITYQPSCHLQNVMGVKEAPQKLLKNIQSVHYVQLPDAKYCCGSAGIYNILQPELSNQILDKKMEKVKKTQSSYIITANPGCLLQMRMGIERDQQSDQVQAVHIVDYLVQTVERAKQ